MARVEPHRLNRLEPARKDRSEDVDTEDMPDQDSQSETEPDQDSELNPSPKRNPWAPVNDVSEADIDDPPEAGEDREAHEAWSPVLDLEDNEFAIDPQSVENEETRPDPWAPIDPNENIDETLLPTSDKPTMAAAPLVLPVYADRDEIEHQVVRLPWRVTANIVEPPLFDLSCLADPTAANSQLLVAHWEWVAEATEGTRLRFRLADDGPSIETDVATTLEARIRCVVRLAGQELDSELELAVSRTDRGIRLGRDLLANRFLVDANLDGWSDPVDGND